MKLMITGERRSGTTLLANFLHAQPHATVYRDFLLIERIRRECRIPDFDTELEGVVRNRLIYMFNGMASSHDKVIPLHVDEFSNLCEFYQLVLDRIAGEGDHIAGHKCTASHASIAPLLQRIPDLKVIYVVRDPRDMVASALRRPIEYPGTLFDHAESWLEAMQVVEPLQAEPRLLILRFEDLVRDTENSLEQLREFLELDELVMPDRLPDAQADSWQHNSSFGDVQGLFDPAPVGRWKEVNPLAGRITQVLLREPMRRWNYDIEQPFSALKTFGVKLRHFSFCRVRAFIGMLEGFIRRCCKPMMNRLGYESHG